MACGRVDKSVDRVEPEPIEVIVTQPHQGVVAEESADFVASRAVEIHRIAPGRVMAMSEVRPEPAQVISSRPEVVVYDVENHRETMAVAGVDQPFEILRTPIGMMRGEQVDPVVSPAARARELADRHQLEVRDAEIAE